MSFMNGICTSHKDGLDICKHCQYEDIFGKEPCIDCCHYNSKCHFKPKETGTMRKRASRNQMLGAFGYSEPDKYCEDWDCDSYAKDALTYRSLGCLCCDNLRNTLLRGKKISVSCLKNHTLIVAVLREDDMPEESEV